jgi:AraC-like DNA-binding protein
VRRPELLPPPPLRVTVLPPRPSLAPFVRAFTIVEARVESTRLLLPEPGLVLGLRYGGFADLLEATGGARRVSDATFAGVTDRARRMRTSAGGGVVLTMFHATGAARFFATPLHELFGATVALDQLVPASTLARIADRLAAAVDHAGRIGVVEDFLLARLRPEPADALVAAAVRAIDAAGGAVRIAPLARALAISQDPLEKRFRRSVGASPKRYAALVRLQRAVRGHRAGTSLSRLAQEAGYFDQSHFIRDFRAITGESPGRLFRSPDYC